MFGEWLIIKTYKEIIMKFGYAYRNLCPMIVQHIYPVQKNVFLKLS